MRALIAVTCLRLLAPAAKAGSFSVAVNLPQSELQERAASIALADGAVVWVEQRGTAAALVAAGEDGVAREVATLPAVAGPARFHGVVASGRTAFVSRLVCASTRCTRNAANEQLRVDLATGAATPFDGCLGDPACRAAAAGCFPALSLAGSVFAVRNCGRQGAVTDLADGTVRYLDGRVLAAAGSFAAVLTDQRDGSRLTVVDWRTGLAVQTVHNVYLAPGPEEASLDADGTLAWAQIGSVEILDPGKQTPRSIALEERDAITQVRVAGGRLAVRRIDPVGGKQLTVSALDGSGVRRVDGQDGRFGWAFDGTRLAWVAQPCAQAQIQVWDLAEGPPAPATDRCIRARLVAAPLKLNRAGTRFKVRLTCPASATRGCAGDVGADVFVAGRKRVETYWSE